MNDERLRVVEHDDQWHAGRGRRGSVTDHWGVSSSALAESGVGLPDNMVRDDGTRGRILETAVRLILTKGYEAMSINDVCHATELTKGAVFHYLSDKEELGIAAAARFADRATQLFANATYHEAADPKDRLLAYVHQRQAAATTFATTPTRSSPTLAAIPHSLANALDHLRQYLTLLFSRQFGAT